MSSLYLIRHGQAGPRHNYDTLSDLGREQAGLLGGHLAAQGVRFTALFSGALTRQRETAELAAASCRGAGVPCPDIRIDTRWNEFDLSAVYDGIAPQIAAEDSAFRRDYEQLLRDAADPAAAIHRTWNGCDIAVARAWIENRYRYQGESWEDFVRRIREPLADLTAFGPGETVAVFTSATPIAIWAALAFDLPPIKTLRLAGVAYNTSVTSLRLEPGGATLFTFNGVPHLGEARLRTFR